jgi:rod shape-determining protein MreC
MVALVSICLFVITVDFRQGPDGPLAAAGASFRAALAPLQEGVTAVVRPVSNFFSGVAHLPSLADENQQLKDDLAQAQGEQAAFEEQQGQLDELYGILGLRRTLDPQGVPAAVVGSGVSNFEWTVTIDHGTDDGIAVGMPVVAGDADGGRLVGQIASVTGDSAVVQLVIDPDHAAAGAIDGHNQGIVVGQGDEDLQMQLIDGDVELSEEEPVFTFGYEVGGHHGRYPPNLLIGTVSSVFEGNNADQVAVTVRPAIDFSSLRYVLVLRTTDAEAEPAA